MKKVIPLVSKDQTGKEMYRLANSYQKDLSIIPITPDGKTLHDVDLETAFKIVKDIPYRRDTKPIEVLARPGVLLQQSNNGLDCKKKSILLSSYLSGRGIPFRLVASSRRIDKRVHHVFPQIKFGSHYLDLDATYNNAMPFKRHGGITHEEELKK